METTCDKDRSPWYFSWCVIVPVIFIFGPVGLLLLWFRPKTTMVLKIVLTIPVVLLTIWLTYQTVNYYQEMSDYYMELGEQLKDTAQ